MDKFLDYRFFHLAHFINTQQKLETNLIDQVRGVRNHGSIGSQLDSSDRLELDHSGLPLGFVAQCLNQ